MTNGSLGQYQVIIFNNVESIKFCVNGEVEGIDFKFIIISLKLTWILFQEYLGVVKDSLATTGSGCNAAISSSTDTIASMIKSDSGRKQLKSLFR